jgi:hypothetical protein
MRYAAAAALLGVALVVGLSAKPSPAPSPAGLSLAGLFTGSTAGDDALLLSALTGELAAVIEWDGQQKQPRLTSGVALDELRTTAREIRMRGVSLGERQPRVRDAVANYLQQQVGTDGGPLTPEQRAKWVAAFRVIEGAAAHAAGK